MLWQIYFLQLSSVSKNTFTRIITNNLRQHLVTYVTQHIWLKKTSAGKSYKSVQELNRPKHTRQVFELKHRWMTSNNSTDIPRQDSSPV